MPTEAPQPPRAPAGIHASIDGLKVQAARYLGARLALLRLEAGEAARETGGRFRSGAVGGALLLCAYLLFWAGALGLAERYQAGVWPLVALAAAALHLLVGVPLLLAAARNRPKPLFEETLNQLKEDEQWMRQMSHRPENPAPKN